LTCEGEPDDNKRVAWQASGVKNTDTHSVDTSKLEDARLKGSKKRLRAPSKTHTSTELVMACGIFKKRWALLLETTSFHVSSFGHARSIFRHSSVGRYAL
jgi:hypothetical protein